MTAPLALARPASSPPPGDGIRGRAALAPTAVGLIAAALAMLGSWIPSLWGDEAASVMSAQRPLESLFAMLAHVDSVHGTYYLGLHAWVDLFGTSPFAIRFPSAIAAGCAAAGVYVVARMLSTSAFALTAGLLCATLPRMTYAGEEARSFAFSAAIAVWLTVLLLMLLRGRTRWFVWAGYGALLAVGIYVFLYVALFALAHAVVLVVLRVRRDVAWRFAAAAGCGIAAALPLVLSAYAERAQVAYLATQDQVTPESVLVSMWFGNGWFALVAWSLIAFGLGASLFLWVRRRRARRKSGLSVELVAAACFFVPSVLLVVVGAAMSVFTARYMTMCAPFAALLIASGLVRIAHNRKAVLACLTAATIAVAVPVYVAQRGPYAKNNSDWAEISSTMHQHATSGDAVLFDASVRPSRRPRLAMRTYPNGFAGLHDLLLRSSFTNNSTWYDTTYSIPAAAAMGRFDGVDRIWVVEYAEGDTVDSWGISDLQSQGFTATAHYRTYRSEIIEMTRPTGS